MSEVVLKRAENITGKIKSEHENYTYIKKEVVSREEARGCVVSVYEVPPGKAAYPYHYHLQNEEVFYILCGQGILHTPQGDKIVSEGDFIFFPANEYGAHKLVNSSVTEALKYIDFSTKNEIDVAFYPDSEKIGVWGLDTNCLFKTKDSVAYYEDE